MKQLDIKQVHERLLNIAVEVDKVCQIHDIPLYMIYGTMLGAIRHKGFIPWDDDMDFAVPYEKYNDLINILSDELPKELRCITYSNSKIYDMPWIKVEDTITIAIDNVLDLPIEEMPGITIDIFPLVSCQKEKCGSTVRKIQNLLRIKRIVFSGLGHTKNTGKKIAKKLLRTIVPFSSKSMSQRIIQLTNSIKPGDYYIIPVNPCYFNLYFPKQWFLPLRRFDFEDKQFFGVSEYDGYLKEIYNDYMTLPPEEKRRIHCDNVFLR